ncbi:MAG: hypothetical protein Q8832_02650, partial [Candidatus Phytoplasma australasiaticum]|nr:hypothetical protein [Candidatus Phytoplasma australasiaticum]
WRRNQHHNLGADSDINLNPNPRLEYIRYADDFISGIKVPYLRIIEDYEDHNIIMNLKTYKFISKDDTSKHEE